MKKIKQKDGSLPRKKKPDLKLKRKSAFRWFCLFFFVSVWMFVLGILVGRGTAPVHFDIKSFPEKLNALNLLNKEATNAEADSSGSLHNPDLGFFEELKKTGEDSIPSDETPKQKSSPPSKKIIPFKRKEHIFKKKKLISPVKKETGLKSKTTEKSIQATTAAVKKKIELEGNYTIQVAALKDPKIADTLLKKLKRKGYPVYSAIGKVGGKGLWYRIRIGSFKNREEAATIMQRLKNDDVDAVIVSR